MKKRTVVVLDDFDGSENARTIAFSFKGVSYEIDLNAEHEAEFVQALQPWIKVARKVARTRAKSGSAAGKGTAAEARAYLREQGHDLPERGRIPHQLLEEFYAAFPEKRS